MKKFMTRYKGYLQTKWPYKESIVRAGISWTYAHQGNDVALDYPGHEIYDQRIEKIRPIEVVMTKAEAGFQEELKKLKEKTDKMFLDIAILMGSSSKWSPRPKISPGIQYAKPYD